jgi:hypothetical protein
MAGEDMEGNVLGELQGALHWLDDRCRQLRHDCCTDPSQEVQ